MKALLDRLHARLDPRSMITMFFLSTRELNRKFGK